MIPRVNEEFEDVCVVCRCVFQCVPCIGFYKQTRIFRDSTKRNKHNWTHNQFNVLYANSGVTMNPYSVFLKPSSMNELESTVHQPNPTKPPPLSPSIFLVVIYLLTTFLPLLLPVVTAVTVACAATAVTGGCLRTPRVEILLILLYFSPVACTILFSLNVYIYSSFLLGRVCVFVHLFAATFDTNVLLLALPPSKHSQIHAMYTPSIKYSNEM